MGPEHETLTEGVKLAAIALVSAVLTASLVIGLGHGLTRRADTADHIILTHAAR